MSELQDVVVYCPTDETEVARLVMARLGAPLEPEWHLAFVLDPSGNATALVAELSGDRAMEGFLAPHTAEELHQAGRYRARYRLPCTGGCGDYLPARGEKLEACGQKLLGHGESCVPMSVLRRMLALV